MQSNQPVLRNHFCTFLAQQLCWLTCLLCLSNLGHAGGLSLDQQQQALQLAQTVGWPNTYSARTRHPLGLQTLSVEKLERKEHPEARWANVFQFDYTRGESRLIVIDLFDQQIQKENILATVHLPLNNDEAEFAISLLEQETDLLDQFRSEQIRRGVQPFDDIHELKVKASIHEPIDSQDPCATERCALLSLFDQTNTVFAAEPVVHLQSIQVRMLNQP